MLLVQCEETERVQKELDETTSELEMLQDGYERLKKKLDVKDERLNQKDAIIAKLKSDMEEMKTSREIELQEAGSIAEAALRLNGIFEAAQRAAEQYLSNVKRINPENAQDRITVMNQPAAVGQRIPYESGWRPAARRKKLHG